MENEFNRDEFFKTFQEFFTKLHKLLKVSDNELVRNFFNNDCVNIHNFLDKTDDPRLFLKEITKLRQGWTSVSNQVFEFEEAESVNIVLTKLEDLLR